MEENIFLGEVATPFKRLWRNDQAQRTLIHDAEGFANTKPRGVRTNLDQKPTKSASLKLATDLLRLSRQGVYFMGKKNVIPPHYNAKSIVSFGKESPTASSRLAAEFGTGLTG